MKIRFIYPKFRKFLEGHPELQEICQEHLVGEYTMPPSLAIPIMASITPPEIEVAVTDDNIGQEIDYNEDVDLVVVSCFTPQAQRAYEICDEFRKRGTTVMIGGIHPTGRPEEAALHADAVGVGEVEPVWEDVLADLKTGKLKQYYRADEKDVYDLSTMPVPKRDIFSKDIYVWDAHLILTTRGCPVRCDGCPIPNKEGVRMRYRPVDDVINDIINMPYKEFYLTDDTVMIPSRRAKKYILELMNRTAELDVSIFMASTMMMYNEPDFYKQLARGGTTSMYTVFGFDRASRELFAPGCSKEVWQKNIDLVHMNEDAGIQFFASYGIGFDDHDKGVFDRILKFSDDAGIKTAEFFIHTPFPGTPFGEQCEKENRILHRNYHEWNTGNVVFEPKQMTAQELHDGFIYLWKEFYRKGRLAEDTIKSFTVNDDVIRDTLLNRSI
jgi:radical SAM superfamily enzyme YgiQ (UPF0313 family)